MDAYGDHRGRCLTICTLHVFEDLAPGAVSAINSVGTQKEEQGLLLTDHKKFNPSGLHVFNL